MKSLPSISDQIDEKIIHKVIKENYGEIFPFFFTFISNWLIRAYSHYKDIDKFLIIIYLIHKQLIFYRKNGLIIDYDTFYKDETIEIDKINISDISKDLKIPKESARRKVIELEKKGVINKKGKKIFVDRKTFFTAKATDTLTELSTLLNKFNKILKKKKLVENIYELNEISIFLKENFSFCLYQLNKFTFIYLNRWRSEVKDLETFCIGVIVVINALFNKEINISKKNVKEVVKQIAGSDSRGVNAMSIAEITGIPRATVVRKLKFLIDKKFLEINEKKLISYNAKDSSFRKTEDMVEKNMLSLSNLIYRLFNQINIIKTN